MCLSDADGTRACIDGPAGGDPRNHGVLARLWVIGGLERYGSTQAHMGGIRARSTSGPCQTRRGIADADTGTSSDDLIGGT